MFTGNEETVLLSGFVSICPVIRGDGVAVKVRVARGRRGLLLAAVVVVALLASSVAIAAGESEVACPELVPEVAFTDVDGNTHEVAIRCLSAWGLTGGVSDVRFEPDQIVARAQMATFLVNLVEAAGGELPEVTESAFDDVSGTHAHNIEVSAQLGLTRGVGPRRFQPDGAVSRAGMATFLVNALVELGVEVPDAAPPFDDTASSVHASSIGALHTLGVVRGVDEQRYEPLRTLNRAQMASMLMGTVEVLVEAGIATPPWLNTDGQEADESGQDVRSDNDAGDHSGRPTVPAPTDPPEAPAPVDGPRFVTTWDTALVDGQRIKLPLIVESGVVIDWGDGTTELLTLDANQPSHTYDKEGVYTVTVTGTFAEYGSEFFQHGYTQEALLSVDEWGETQTTSIGHAFANAENLTSVVEPPSSVTNMRALFTSASSFNQPIGDWDVSHVTDMRGMFYAADSFNQPIGDWNVASVTDMSGMFGFAGAFNQPIGDWDVSNVLFMDEMFTNAGSFNQDLSTWCVEDVRLDTSTPPAPVNFAIGANAWTEARPVWGTCPD